MKREGSYNRLFKTVDYKRRQKHFYYIFNGFISLADLPFFVGGGEVFPRLRHEDGFIYIYPVATYQPPMWSDLLIGLIGGPGINIMINLGCDCLGWSSNVLPAQ